jgi:hypothetical protein
MSEAVFINVEVADDIRGDAEMAKKLEESCPVDIYAASNGGVEVVEANLDECILCGPGFAWRPRRRARCACSSCTAARRSSASASRRERRSRGD